jgi:eukaryotic-like serine/threonine-protein kinase
LAKLGKYELIGELGRGGMGIVYRARDPIINRLVALKTITAGVADYPNLLQRFYREAQSAGGLQHPNIVTIYDMGEEAGTPYIAMELIEGESLEQVISARPDLPLSLKLTYAIQACRAFDYAHKRGIVHRDIKPANVMLSKDGTVKVVDFGIARVLESSKTQTGMLMGTFAYMSPEQYHGEHADERSDIWSFGVLLFELLTYQRPFSGEAPAALMNKICQQEPTPLHEVAPECPPELEAILERIFQKKPADRYQSMEDLLVELDPICKSFQSVTVLKLVEQGSDLVRQGNYSQARDILRQALQIESSNTQARGLLEKVNVELKRALVRPKVQQFVEKGLELLALGKVQEARAEAENALKLDTNFEPAQELKHRVQEELDRFQLIAEYLDAAKLRLAEGLPEAAEGPIAKVLELEPSNKTARALRDQVEKDKTERERRLRLLEALQQARSLWTLQNYQKCIEILTGLEKEFPREEEVLRLLETAREDYAEQSKRRTIEKAKNVLAAGRHDECNALLLDLRKSFPEDREIGELLASVREDQANQRRLKSLAEARRLFAGRQYDECLSLVAALQQEFPGDSEFAKLAEAVRADQEKQYRQEGITKAGKLLAARRYEECSALLAELQQRFPKDDEISRLRNSLAEDEAEQRKVQSLAEARSLLASCRYDESLTLLARLQRQYAGDAEILHLTQTVRSEQSEQRKLHDLAHARNLLADESYDESITLLTELEKEFKGEDEIAKLLARARRERAEKERQEKLTEARAHLAESRFGEALIVLEGLLRASPNDAGVQKLLRQVQRDQEKQSKLNRLQHEREELKKLVSTKKYPEVIARAEKLLQEFPGDSDLVRFAEFARAQQTELERDVLLRKNCETIEAFIKADRFPDAVRAAVAALRTFPGNEELLRLQERAEVQDKKEQTRKAIEQRVRDIRVKINREKFSDAIQLANETLVTLGPDTDIKQLLNSAQVEFAAREKKRKQEQELESIRLLVKRGQLEDATQALNQSLAAETLANFDPRVQRVSEEIDAARSQTSAPSPSKPDSGPPPGLSKEYAWEGPPPPADLGGVDSAAQTRLAEPQSSPISPSMSSPPVAPAVPEAPVPPVLAPPPLVQSVAPAIVPEAPVREQPKPLVKSPAKLPVEEHAKSSAPVVPETPARPTAAAPPAVEPPVMQPKAPIKSPEPAAPSRPKSTEATPVSKSPIAKPPIAKSPIAESPSKESRSASPTPPRTITRPVVPEPAPRPAPIPPPAPKPAPVIAASAVKPRPVTAVAPWKRPAVIAGIAAVMIAAAWFGLHHPSSEKTNPSQTAPQVAVQPEPVVNPLEVRQREAMDQADQRRAAGDLNGAAQLLQSAAALNGPLSADIQKKQGEIQAEINDSQLRGLRQKEALAWQNARKDVDAGRFSSAEKYLANILALPEGGLRRDDAKKYQDQVIPQRKQEETLWAQAKKDSQKNDLGALKQADNTLGQVIQLDGPRKSEAGQLRQTVEGKVVSLGQQQQHQQQIADLRAGAQRDLAQGDFSSARQKVDQIKQAGGDPASLSTEIDQAEARRQSEADFQQVVQRYQAANDKNTLEAARSSFQSMAQGGGSHAGDARRYLGEISSKLAAMKQETAPTVQQPTAKVEAPTPAPGIDERPAITNLVQQYGLAFEHRDADALRKIWPTIGNRYDKYKQVFGMASEYRMDVHIESVDVAPDAQQATVNASLSQEYTLKGQKPLSHRDKAVFHLVKSGGVWAINDVQ